MKRLVRLSEDEIVKGWNDSAPIVSATVIAYNHAQYIEEAINSVLAQVTTFPFEVIIHDDASTDGTQEIIREIALQYPRVVRSILQTENQWKGKGINATTSVVWPSARGKYIAWLEGDDYWIDPLKLQKQVDLLESNNHVVLCFTSAKIETITGELVDDFITQVPAEETNLGELARFGNYVHTPTVVFRNRNERLPRILEGLPLSDYPLYVYLSQFGNLKFIPESTAVYRHGIGSWSLLSSYERNFRTSIVFGALRNYFHEKKNEFVSTLFLERIHSFINRFYNLVTHEQLKAIADDNEEFLKILQEAMAISRKNNKRMGHLYPWLTKIRNTLNRIKGKVVR